MAKYRILLIVTFAWLTVLFNVERIDLFEYEPLINLDTLVYVISLGVTLAIVAYPNLGQVNFLVSAGGLTLFYVVLALLTRPNWANRDPLLPVLEIAALLLTLVLMRRVSDAILEFEMTVESFVLDVNGTRLLPRTEGAEEFNHEMYRARRFERPFAMVYVEIPPVKIKSGEEEIETDYVKWKITDSFKKRYLQVQLAKAISHLTYQGDLIIEYDNAIVVGLPETNENEATVFMVQLHKLVRSQFGEDTRIGSAVFPNDGLIFEDLVKVATENADFIVSQDDSNDDDSQVRTGDVLLTADERQRVVSESEWLSKLAYQSYSARAIYMVTKRVIDLMLVLLSLPLVLPLGALVALAIIIDNPGNPIFVQERTGYGGKRFKMYKFRSMIMNAPPIQPTIVIGSDGIKRYIWPDKEDGDPRITRVGKIIRKTSLDELPQLYNVLIGDMSIVGPRPTSWSLDKYTLHQTQRLMVRPGITGLWQVCAREAKNMDERLIWDMQYINKISLWLDIQIMFRTVTQIVAKRGT